MLHRVKNKIKQIRKRGFTLIELIIVIVILGVISALVIGNFITSLKKGRDTRRKSDLDQIQQALELYYEDNKHYPILASEFASDRLCYPNNDCTTKVYMEKVPKDPLTRESYGYETDSSGSYYKLYANLENNLDQGPGVNQTGYSEASTPICNPSPCKYGVSSPNTYIASTETGYAGGAVGGELPIPTTPPVIPTNTIAPTSSIPTSAPTSSIPTSIPTIVPTTFSPTFPPSIAPTSIPASTGPTAIPTILASPTPTITPTPSPTTIPTPTPTVISHCATITPAPGSVCIDGTDNTWCYDSDGPNNTATGSCRDSLGTYNDYCSTFNLIEDFYCTGDLNGSSYTNVNCVHNGNSCYFFCLMGTCF